MIWKAIVPLKVKILAWSTAYKRTNTNDWVQRKRPSVCLSPQWCVLCKKEGESVDHLFLHCDISIALWQRLFNLANLSWVRPQHSYSLLEVEFRGFSRSKRAKVLWNSVVLAIFWAIWIERNSRIFRDLVEEMDGVWDRVCFLASLWALVDKSFEGIPLFFIIRNWREICASKPMKRRDVGSHFYPP
ncbi:hypothetical protein L1049_007440 [Liquidambar formosana]|uniref:Reverse transcriptase zinc-binding domain-containing protein n=1 Tax=Liquidambar formosana TaxID=63359 RepID=A0AAP0N5L6_LIQFO